MKPNTLERVIYTYGYLKYSQNVESFNHKYRHDSIKMEVRPTRYKKDSRRYGNGYQVWLTDMTGTRVIEHLEDVFISDLASNAIRDFIVAWHNVLVNIENKSNN